MLYPSKNLFVLKGIIEKIKSKSFSIETQYKFLKLSKIIDSEIEIFEEQRRMLIENFGERDEAGNFIVENGGVKIKVDSQEECEKKVKELNEMQVQFPDTYFSLSELEPLELTLEDLLFLDQFIKN